MIDIAALVFVLLVAASLQHVDAQNTTAPPSPGQSDWSHVPSVEAFSTAAPSEWYKLDCKTVGFVAYFPGKPGWATSDGSRVLWIYYSDGSTEQFAVLASVSSDIAPDQLDELAAKAENEAITELSTGRFSVIITARRRIHFSDGEGREMTILTGGVRAQILCVVRSKGFYVVRAIDRDTPTFPEHANAFLHSFQLTPFDPPQ